MSLVEHHEKNMLSAVDLAAWFRKVYNGSPAGLIFDCDGVLVDSCAGNTRYYNLLRKALGLPPISPEQVHYVQMSTAEQALDAIIPVPLRPALRDAARSISYSRDILPFMKTFDGLRDLLDACRQRGLHLGVHTNRLNGMDDLLHMCDLEGIFDPVVTAAAGPAKPHPHGTQLIVSQWNLPPESLLFVGDSTTDRDAAGGADVPFLAFRNPDLVPQGSCYYFKDLLEALRLVWAEKCLQSNNVL